MFFLCPFGKSSLSKNLYLGFDEMYPKFISGYIVDTNSFIEGIDVVSVRRIEKT